MKRRSVGPWLIGRLALLAVSLAGLAGCGEPPGSWFQVRNDTASPAFVVLDAELGRYVYALQPGSNVAVGDFLYSFSGDVDVLGPTCQVIAVFKSPISQTNVFAQPTNRWEGIYQITIPSVGQPTFADTRRAAVDPALPTISGAVLAPNSNPVHVSAAYHPGSLARGLGVERCRVGSGRGNRISANVSVNALTGDGGAACPVHGDG
ncbi:MAG: hypothetical protein ACRDGI_09095 [Candidatus Limnocylindrales bacterium]